MPGAYSHTHPDAVIGRAVDRLRHVPGTVAIVLGGSRAQGTHTEASDVDIGLYYEPDRPLDIQALGAAAAELDDARRPEAVTSIGGWGPWINGGGWLRVEGVAVDVLYRDLSKVRRVIDDCRAGRVTVDYQPGHPHAFVSAIYAGEAAVCRPLHDPSKVLDALKARVWPYPPALKRALCDRFAWEIDFSLRIAEKAAGRADAAYAAGACFRAVACMNQVLFARNERYLLNEKGATSRADALPVHPPRYRDRVEAAFAHLRADPGEIRLAVLELDAVNADLQAAFSAPPSA